ncbi:hypothetical protein [Roseibium album]|uniref:hypothetical protein n=1 Tax=Roseibium album TaxID=311410 RepID=UPI00391CE639
MTGSKNNLVQATQSGYVGGEKVAIARNAFPTDPNPDDGDAVMLVDDETLAKMTASGKKVEKIEWSGSMADPDGDPTETDLYPDHVPLTARQSEMLRKSGTVLYRVSGISREDIASIAEKLGGASALEVVKPAGQLASGQTELTVKANDTGALALLKNVGVGVIVC